MLLVQELNMRWCRNTCFGESNIKWGLKIMLFIRFLVTIFRIRKCGGMPKSYINNNKIIIIIKTLQILCKQRESQIKINNI